MPTGYEIAVAGGGPAGLTAALFAARHGRTTVLLDPLCMGGAILNTERIEDLPGFPEGVPGFDFGPRLAVSPQCGFASGEISRTMTPDEQEAKLRLIGDVARRVWP